MDYGLFLMIELAKENNMEPLSLRKIANSHHMSFFFLQKVAADLRQANLIQASRGKNGGYLLNNSPDKITVKDILEALEGKIALMHCLTHTLDELPTCAREKNCDMRSGLDILNQMLLKILSETSLAFLMK